MKYIILFVFLALVPITGSAYAYYITFLDFTWDGPPLVCVLDSDYNRHAIIAINAWQDALYDNFGEGYNFVGTIIKLNTLTEVIEQCRIFIIYVEEEYAAFEDLDKQGMMLHQKGLNHVFIYVYEGRGNIYKDLEEFDNSMIRTTMHEMGHAFGLGHVTSDKMGERLKPWPDSIMWAISEHDSKIKIDSATLEGFRLIYPGNSWMGSSPHPFYQLEVFFPELTNRYI